jgi:hypothetical protein
VKHTSLPLVERRHPAGSARANPAGSRDQIQPLGSRAGMLPVAAVTAGASAPKPQASTVFAMSADESTGGGAGAGTAAGGSDRPLAATITDPPTATVRIAAAATASRARCGRRAGGCVALR